MTFIYSSWRISELLALHLEYIDLEAVTIKGGQKPKLGKGVLFQSIPKSGALWAEIMGKLEMQHTPH